MSLRVGVDIGGTFTDFALLHDGGVVLEKTLSTPEDPSRAVMAGLEQLAARRGQALRDFLAGVDAIVHATTIGDNTLIESKGAVTGLLTTAGFRDELELRRGFKEDIWDVRLPPPHPIVPRRRRFGVPERIRFDGSVALPLDEDAARESIARLARQGVESVAIALLFSFVNPAHEKRLAELVAEAMPGVPISLSHEVMPKAPEFERTSTTVVNAYVGPRLTGYLDRLETRLREAGFAREVLVMQSSGGVMTRAYLRDAPVRALASGPAGGVIGAARFGVSKGAPDLLCVDMGGTSYDVSVVRRGEAPAQPGWNWHHRYVIGLPMVSVETLGAGGGSVCDARGGVLRVGPASAGSDPGPVCYGRGGTQPTVTDAALVLGLLSEAAEFAGGAFRLSRKGVDDAFQKQVADSSRLQRRSRGVRLLACRERQHDPGRAALDRSARHRPTRTRDGRLRRQWPALRGDPGPGTRHLARPRAAHLAGVLGAGRAGGVALRGRGAVAPGGRAAGGRRPARRPFLRAPRSSARLSWRRGLRGRIHCLWSAAEPPLPRSELVARHRDRPRGDRRRVA